MLSQLFRKTVALFGRLRRDKKGAAMAEYAILVAGVALVALAAVSILGHKVNDMVAASAAILPGAHGDDNQPIASGRLVETAANADGALALDAATILANSDGTKERLGDNLGFTGLSGLVVDQ